MLEKLTANLIRFASVDAPGNVPELKKIVAFVKKQIHAPGVFIQKHSIKGKPALYVSFKKNHKKPTLILNGHLDVVPADKTQFQPKIISGKLLGRGTHDMKSGCAVMIALIKFFASKSEKPDVGFMFVCDEEQYGDASRTFFEKGFRPRLLMPLEPTNFELVTETKGILWMTGNIPGVAAHGSMPWLGTNPIELFSHSVVKLQKAFPPLKKAAWKTTCNIGTTHSGDSRNRVPPDLTFELDIRFIPTENFKTIISNVKKCFPKNTRWTIARCEPPHQRAKDMSLIRMLQKTASSHGIPAPFARAPFCTDARFFAAGGINCAVFGPIGGGMHAHDEWVDLASLDKLFLILRDFMAQLP